MIEMLMKTGNIRRAAIKSPTSTNQQIFTGPMPFLLSNQQRQSTVLDRQNNVIQTLSFVFQFTALTLLVE